MAADGVFCELGKRHFFAADYRHGADKSVFGIGALLFDGKIIVDPLVEHLQNKVRLFFVGVLGFRLKMLIRIDKKDRDWNSNREKQKDKDQL